MSRVKICVVTTLACGILFGAVPTSAANKCSKILSFTSSDWKPSSETGKIGMPYNYEFELLEGIFNTANCEFTHHTSPFQRVLREIEQGTVDGTVGISYTKDRAEFSWFSRPYRREIISAYMRTTDIATFRPKTMQDLASSSLRIGVDMGAWYGDAFETIVRNHPNIGDRIVVAETFEQKFIWLAAGGVDLVLHDIGFASRLIERTNLVGKIAHHPFEINNSDVHLIYSKKSVPLSDVRLLDKAIKTFKGTQHYRTITKRYMKP